MNPVYSFGYTGRQLSTLQESIGKSNALLLDIRFSPRSRVPMWNRRNLEMTFGDRYLWVGNLLGNSMYRTNSIAIVDMARGLELISRIAAKQPVALMCVCASPIGCHRSTITHVLLDAGFQVLEHPPTTFSAPSDQPE